MAWEKPWKGSPAQWRRWIGRADTVQGFSTHRQGSTGPIAGASGTEFIFGAGEVFLLCPAVRVLYIDSWSVFPSLEGGVDGFCWRKNTW